VAEALTRRWRRYNQTRQELFDLESSGQAYLVLPETMTVTNHSRSLAALQASYEAGWAQCQREAPRWRDFLGV